MKLTIVIPAYNEEQAIGSIIERTLTARSGIIQQSSITDVEIIVVSDGSTDRTADIARTYDDVQVIVFEVNRGYGAAIKRGFAEGTGELVGFLDADGTCDPTFFGTLVRALDECDAAIALGSRMGPDSEMPRIRRLGNRVYAVLLSMLSNRHVTDSASGMRVIRRSALASLYPLPDGLHFTPAMSARAIMDDRLGVVEVPMPYKERIGDSKLHVLLDGWRFLRTILEMTLVWRPAKLLGGGAVFCLLLMLLLAMHPLEMWIRVGRLEEDMIYRLLFCSLLGSIGTVLFSACVVCERIRLLVETETGRLRTPTFVGKTIEKLASGWGVVTVITLGVPLAIWAIGQGVWTWITAGYVAEHWSRVVLAGLIVFIMMQWMVTALISHLVRFHTLRRPQHNESASLLRSAERRIDAPASVRAETDMADATVASS